MLKIRNILFPTDGTVLAEHAYAQAAFYAVRHGAKLHVLHVSIARGERVGTLVTDSPVNPEGFRAKIHEAAAESLGVELLQADLTSKTAEDGIVDYASSHEIDLIVMATHGRRGIDHALIGSTAEAVVRSAPCPVLTVRPTAGRYEVEVSRIIVPVDFSEHAWLATAHAKELAQLFKATVHLVHVMEILPTVALTEMPEILPTVEMQADARQALNDLYQESEGPKGAFEVHVEIGHPVIESLNAAERLDADLMVIASHGRTGLKRILMGSVAEKMVQKAPCPVLVVKSFGRSLLRPEKDSLAETS